MTLEEYRAAADALFRPQGTCPKPWVVAVDGVILRDARGAVRRFCTKQAAERAGSVTRIRPYVEGKL